MPIQAPVCSAGILGSVATFEPALVTPTFFPQSGLHLASKLLPSKSHVGQRDISVGKAFALYGQT